jgi:hypothetical protein
MLSRSIQFAMLVALLAVLSGCSQRLLDFTVVSSKDIAARVSESGRGERVTGEDAVPIILIPIGTPSIKEAVDRAIESAGPGYDALVDGVLTYKWLYFIVGEAKYIVEGTPIKTSEFMSSLNTDGNRLALGPILYHSKRGISNTDAIAQLGIVQAGGPKP